MDIIRPIGEWERPKLSIERHSNWESPYFLEESVWIGPSGDKMGNHDGYATLKDATRDARRIKKETGCLTIAVMRLCRKGVVKVCDIC